MRSERGMPALFPPPPLGGGRGRTYPSRSARGREQAKRDRRGCPPKWENPQTTTTTKSQKSPQSQKSQFRQQLDNPNIHATLVSVNTFGPGATDLGKITKPAMARGTTNSTLTAKTDNIKAIETIDGRTGGTIRPELIAPGPRRRQRRLHSQELPSVGRAGSGFPRTDRRVAQWGPRNTSHTAQPGPSRAVGYPWTRNVDPVSLHGRDHGVSWSPSQ